jgi:hypothetical protein
MSASRDRGPSEEPQSSQRKQWPSDRTRWLIEKCALPVTILLVPILFQYMANRQAQKEKTWAAERVAVEEAAADLRAQKERHAADERARQEQRVQLYTSLLNKREETDTAVRRDIFQSLMGSYLEGKTHDRYEKLVQLELLALNFHDILNLSPLFWDLQRQFENASPLATRGDLLDQLDRIAREVKEREADVLALDGFRRAWDVPLTCVEEYDLEKSHWRVPSECRVEGSDLPQARPEQKMFHVERVGGSPANGAPAFRDFALGVNTKDTSSRRLQVTLSWPDPEMEEQRTLRFWVDIFDFPLVNFSRISATERVAVVLSRYDKANEFATVVFLYFPSNRSAAKDKPYIEDLTRQLLAPPASGEPVAQPAPGASQAGEP